jgi:predicted NUDIX family phosphoesterase
MTKECLTVSRNSLEKSGFIPEGMNSGFNYTKIENLGELIKLLRVIKNTSQYYPRHGENGVDDVYYPNLQQPIIYAYVLRSDGRFLLYQRGGQTKDSTYKEGRLAGKVSVGIGGHMEPTDLSLPKSFYREMEEEAEILVTGEPINLKMSDGTLNIPLMKKCVSISPVGLIKDERTPVDRDHFGIVCKIIPQTNEIDVRIRIGEGQENIGWQYVSPTEYLAMQENGQIIPENWTRVVFLEELSNIQSPL